MEFKPSQRLIAEFKAGDVIDIERISSDIEEYAVTLYTGEEPIDDYVYSVFEATAGCIPVGCRIESVEDALWDLCREICVNVQEDLQ